MQCIYIYLILKQYSYGLGSTIYEGFMIAPNTAKCRHYFHASIHGMKLTELYYLL